MKSRVQNILAFFLFIVFGLVPIFAAESSLADMAPPAEQPSECLNCHRYRNLNSNEGILSSQRFCYDCHQEEPSKRGDFRASKISLQVKPEFFSNSSHRFVSCIQCHTKVARSPHRTSDVFCSGCHRSTAISPGLHSDHARVRCEACHTDSPYIKLDAGNNEIRLSRVNEHQAPISLAQHKTSDLTQEALCRRCHTPGNKVGAPNTVLPSKSIFCIACHYSPIELGSRIFLIALGIALLGVFGTLFFWFKASVQGEPESVHKKIQLGSEVAWSKLFSTEFFSVVKTIVFDVFLQRRILTNSVARWLIHSLIFYSFLARFLLSVFTLIIQKTSPESELVLSLVNRDNPFVASFNDITGLFILIGVIWAMIRRFITKPEHVLTEEQDTIALIIIGLLAFSGFILEGIRITIGQIPPGIAISAFGGYFMSLVLSFANWNWQSIYGYIWYIHTLLWAVFIAYLPFGKLKHIITTPISLLLNYKKA